MRKLVATAVALLALPLASCSGGGGDDDTFVLTLDGRARVEGAAGSLASGRHRLEEGDVVRVVRGTAVLGLPGDRSLELRTDSEVEVAAQPTVVDGPALAVSGEGETLRVRIGEARVDLRAGAARLRRSTGADVGVYEGRARVRALGRARTVKALRQLAVTDTGDVAREPGPLVYDRDAPDEWDRRYLQPAIDLGGQLERHSLALTRRLRPTTVDLAYLRSVVPALAGVTSGPPLRPDRSIGETVIGAAIAVGGRGDVARRWTKAVAFREQGADWGLVALDQRAERARVLGALDAILDVSAGFTTVNVGGPATTSTTTGPRSSAPVRPTTPTTEPQGLLPTPTPTPTPTTPTLPPVTIPPLLPPPPSGPSSPPSTPTPTIPPTVTEPVTGVVQTVGGLLQPVTDTVNGLLDTVGGLLSPSR